MYVFEELIDEKLMKVLKLLIKNPDQQFHLQKIAEETNVPIATVFRVIKRLVQLNLVEQITISKFKIYTIAHNKKTKQLYLALKNG